MNVLTNPFIAVSAVAAGANNGTFCPEGQYWDGSAFPDFTSNKHLECFVDTSLSLLSLRLHRVNITLVPPPSPTDQFGMVWELVSRHINYSLPRASPQYHECAGDTVDISCNLSQCDITANEGCTDIVYECNHAHCFSRALF